MSWSIVKGSRVQGFKGPSEKTLKQILPTNLEKNQKINLKEMFQ
jgi:hypothetical protein